MDVGETSAAYRLNGVTRSRTLQVPVLVQACINHLTVNGLNVVGIFRVSTSKRRIRQVSNSKNVVRQRDGAIVFLNYQKFVFSKLFSYVKNLTMAHCRYWIMKLVPMMWLAC